MIERATLTAPRPARGESHEDVDDEALAKLPREYRIAHIRERHRKAARAGNADRERVASVEYR